MSEKMIFCVGEGKYVSKGSGYHKNLQIFNKNVTEEVFNTTRSNLSLKNFKLPIAKWVDIKEIKNPTTTQTQLCGYLKILSYKNAWKEMWEGMSKEDKEFIGKIQNFNSEIFEQITGIKYEISLKETLKIGELTYSKEDVESALKNIKPIN